MTKQEWNKLDNLIAKFSKEDKNYTCETCGRTKEQGWAIHHHHWQGRRHTALRWVNENIFICCYTCHQKWENDPIWSVKTAVGLRGDKWLKLIEKIKDLENHKTFEQNEALIGESLETILKSYASK